MIKKKKNLIIISAASLLLIFGFLLYFFFHSKISPADNKIIEVKQKTLQEQKIELQADLANFNKAQELQSLDLCKLIKDGESKNFCIQEIASKTDATSSCLLINNKEGQSNCSSQILFRDIVKNKNLADCEKIEQTMLKKSCIESIAENNYDSNCSVIAAQDLKNTCLSIIYYQQAKIKNDSKVCLQIPELIRRANCLSEIGKIDLHSDADKDGLDFLQEIINGTNPNNPDTDGDGYKDGAEVSGGFNPDGTGALVKTKSLTSVECKTIKDINIQAICFSELKDAPLDLLKCNDLKNSRLRDYCLNALKSLK